MSIVAEKSRKQPALHGTVRMADGSDINSPEAQARIAAALVRAVRTQPQAAD